MTTIHNGNELKESTEQNNRRNGIEAKQVPK